jgi:uncharacterized protein involved in response to NO
VNGNIGGIPRYRETSFPAVFSQGFRPFFLLAAAWAPIALALWLLEFAGIFQLPTVFEGAAWHAHEMIFGFAAAAMAGFLMTAIPNWTGRMPLQGLPLAILAAAWVLGRIAVALSAWTGAVAAASCDLAFPVLLILALGREVLAGRNWRNLPMLAGLGLLLVANAATHLAAAGVIADDGIGTRGGIAVFAAMLALVGGRVIPSFTRNRLVKIGSILRPASFGLLDRMALISAVLALAAWVADLPPTICGPLLLLAGILAAMRLIRWHGQLTLGDPSLWILHAGYAWLAIGLALLGASALIDAIPPMAGLHALSAGAIGSSILGVMGRTTLAQTGRRATSVTGANAIHGLITIAAVLRVVAAAPWGSFWPLLAASACAWILAFGGFLFLYGEALIGPKRGRPTA